MSAREKADNAVLITNLVLLGGAAGSVIGAFYEESKEPGYFARKTFDSFFDDHIDYLDSFAYFMAVFTVGIGTNLLLRITAPKGNGGGDHGHGGHDHHGHGH